MVNMPTGYYNRFDSGDNYEEHLFIAGRYVQSAEFNELQKNSAHKLRSVADALFKDGDIVRDATVIVNSSTGLVQCQSGAVYIRGAIRGVPPATLTIPTTGSVAIGVRLIESVVTVNEDPDLRDPAAGARSYQQPGADRLKVDPSWAFSTGGDTDFYPVYSVTDGVLDAKEAPPSLDTVNQSIARYDRDSTGTGSYVVTGMTVKALPDVGAVQNYSLLEGRCRVYGSGFDFVTARRIQLNAVPDLKLITNEPHLSTTIGSQRVNLDRTPATLITQVTIQTTKTVTLTHGNTTGAQDPLPDTSVLSIISVSQGGTTYTATSDYLLTAGKVDWSPGGAEPATGSTYSVTYQYIKSITPTAVDENGFTVTGAVVGTQILTTYSQKLPRIDRLCINTKGLPVWQIGVSAEYFPQPPTVPDDVLPIASVYQTWTSTRRVSNDGVRVVPMPQLAAVENRMDLLMQLIAQQRLESDIHTRESGTKKGLFTDPFLDESQRDAGTAQTAAIVAGVLTLPIDATIASPSTDIQTPATLAHGDIVRLEQVLRTGSMQINPYMAFAPVPANIKLTPDVDRWTSVQTSWTSSVTRRFSVGSGNQSSSTTTTRSVLLSTTTVEAENLRPITVSYTISGFGPGETLASITFDGVSLPTGSAVANSSGIINGTLSIPAGIPAGAKQVRAVGAGGSEGVATFVGQGTIERQVWQQQTTVNETRWQSPPPPAPAVISDGVRRTDPLAQTFILPVNTQVTGIDIWFAARPTTMTRVQIRTTATGFPDQRILAQATLVPAAANIGGAHTRVHFDYPVTLFGGTEYAIVVLCDDAVGALSLAELGKFDATAQRWITSQPYTVGVMLSSSNASTWTVHQDRDLAFRILGAAYTQTSRSISLGNVPVSGATDLMLMSYAERPASATGIKYLLTLPDASVVTVDDGQPIQLPAAITGNVGITAELTGDAEFSPVLFPGTQLVSGIISASGDYVTRSIPAGTAVTVKVIYEAFAPGGSTITAQYKGPDIGDTWTNFSAPTTRVVDDGFVEFIHVATGITELSVQIKLLLAGSTVARPRVRDLRVIVI